MTIKVTPIKGPEVEQRYTSTLSLTPALDGMGVKATPRLLYPRERPGTHCIGGWVGRSERVRKISPPTGIR